MSRGPHQFVVGAFFNSEVAFAIDVSDAAVVAAAAVAADGN